MTYIWSYTYNIPVLWKVYDRYICNMDLSCRLSGCASCPAPCNPTRHAGWSRPGSRRRSRLGIAWSTGSNRCFHGWAVQGKPTWLQHPLVSNEAVARVFKRLADRLQGVVSDTSRYILDHLIYHLYTIHIQIIYKSCNMNTSFIYYSYNMYIPFIYLSYNMDISFIYHSYSMYIPFIYNSFIVHIACSDTICSLGIHTTLENAVMVTT